MPQLPTELNIALGRWYNLEIQAYLLWPVSMILHQVHILSNTNHDEILLTVWEFLTFPNLILIHITVRFVANIDWFDRLNITTVAWYLDITYQQWEYSDITLPEIMYTITHCLLVLCGVVLKDTVFWMCP